MITIIFAPPRTGKTCFMTYILNEYAFDRSRTRKMQQEIYNKNLNGFTLSCPKHCVSANYNITFRKFGYNVRYNRYINPYKLGFFNLQVPTHFNLPYEVIGITEAQKYLNSRMSRFFPDWQSRFYEQHGHNNLDIFLDTQRPMLIDVNIRELSRFIEIISLSFDYDKFGRISKMHWIIREIDNSGLFDKYMSSGKSDKTCYIEKEIVAKYNVFDLYDSQSCKPKFYEGHFDSDFDYVPSYPFSQTKQGFLDSLDVFNDELPENFYFSKSKKD